MSDLEKTLPEMSSEGLITQSEDTVDTAKPQELQFKRYPDKKERDKSLILINKLFILLNKEIHRSNLYAAIICGGTTFFAGIVPIATYILLPSPYDSVFSLSTVAAVVDLFRVRYRSKKTRFNWKITFIETIVIIIVATVASLILGGIA